MGFVQGIESLQNFTEVRSKYKKYFKRGCSFTFDEYIYHEILPGLETLTRSQGELLSPSAPFYLSFLPAVTLIARQVWEIIGRLSGVFNGAALMESFSRTSVDFITSVRQLRLIYKAV